MNRFALLAAVLTSTILSAHGQPSAVRQAVVLTNVTVIDATGAAPKPGMTVVMTGDRIATIDKTGDNPVPSGATIVNAAGKFLIPGLWDMHVHWGLEAFGRSSR